MGKLVVGANELTALYLLRVMGEFRRLHPAIRIVVHRSLGSQLPDDIRRHKCEFGVLTYEPHDPELASVVVYSDELIFVVPPQHPLARESRVSIRQLGAESFVAHIVPSPYRDKVIQAFEKYKTPLHMGVELPTLQAIKRFVALGNGVAFLPEISVEDEIARGDLVRIPVQELSVHRELRLIHRKTGTLSHAGRAFLKVAESFAHIQGGRYRFERDR